MDLSLRLWLVWKWCWRCKCLSNFYPGCWKTHHWSPISSKSWIPHGPLYYSLENCRKEIICYKKLYKVGKSQNIQPYFLFTILDRGFFTAAFGYQMYKAADLKIDAMHFGKTAEKFGTILGNEIVTRGNPNYYNLENLQRFGR